MKATLSAVRDDPGRTAMCITLILHGSDKAMSRYPTVLSELLELEDQAQVVRSTDRLGVVRWHAAATEDTDAVHGDDLGAQVLDTGEFRLSPYQMERLGL